MQLEISSTSKKLEQLLLYIIIQLNNNYSHNYTCWNYYRIFEETQK